jgi:hypothetical protein
MQDITKRAPRTPIQLSVEFNHQETGLLTLKTKNISDTGVYIALAPEQHPPIGTLAKIQLKNSFADGEPPPSLTVKVVRHDNEGIGLEFVL